MTSLADLLDARRSLTALAGAFAVAIALPAAYAQPEDEGAADVEADAGEDNGETKAREHWDVDSPPGPSIEQTIDTDEGTWISLDVSPDGAEIVFDLLGDLYIMPIEGGEPEKLTSGIAWDMQPRFSPDGGTIAFTSDRTGSNKRGGDNIWTIDRDGENLRQITSETFRLLNGPNWSPDGEYIVARKHFTSRRSLGAGEMWMYHRSGVEGRAAGGLQLTERPTDQKDVNEPVFSPCGRYLYYSEDVSPGQTFQYNKDSHGQIYVINRLDLETGETERYITGPGGAVRPTPSPDGKVIAFVRRHDGKSALHLFDTESGAVTMVYDDLERDMQEAWAIHGVYPAMAWTPDGGSIVFWARGKIRRLDIESGEASVIPFRVRDTRTVTPALRTPIEVAPDEFEVRLLQSVEVSPDGERVVFQALGHVYIRDLPDGTPRRLTEQDDHFEFYPSFSRCGGYVVYTTWHDQDLGTVRVVRLADGASWAVVDAPGHYTEPVFTPGGDEVVYRRVGGGSLTTPLWSRDTGVYRAPVGDADNPGAEDETEPRVITRSGSRPQFAESGDRVFVVRAGRRADADNTSLVSMTLDGAEERTHYTSTWAQDFRVSPDGRWVAFIERFNVHVAPMVRTGRAVRVGPNSSALPLARVSAEAGEWVHFSGDGERLHWSLGPTLYTRELTETFAFLEGAPEELPEPPAEGLDIGFTAEHDVPASTIALVGGRVITMNGDKIIERGTVLIEGNRIAAVGPEAEVDVPSGAHVVDVSGQTVLPGFIDVHAHGGQAASGLTPQQNWVDLTRLAFGVTTVHDPSNNTNAIFAASELTKAGMITAPRTFSTGTILYGAAGSFKAEIDSLDDAAFHLRRMQAVGAFSVKSYNQPRRDQRQQVIAAARDLGMMVVPEGGSTFMHNLTMVVDGHTGIEHTLPVEIVYKDVLDLWKGTSVGYTPTLSVGYGGISGEFYWYDVDDVWRNPRVQTFIPPHVINPRSRRRQKAPQEDYNHFLIARITKQLVDIGEIVHAGGHGQLSGLDTHWEIWMFVQGGMTPHEALRSGTLSGAEYLGLDGDIGSIEPGKLADIVVLDPGRDPLDDIRDTEFIQHVVANGRLYDARTLNQVHPDRRERAPMFWEQDGFSPSLIPAGGGFGCVGCQYPSACSLSGLQTGGHTNH